MKKSRIVFPLFGADYLANILCNKLHYEIGKMTEHQFPDSETLMTIDSNVSGRDIIFVATLDRPNIKFMSLLFAAQTARELGANKITLIAPYLPYMRQDKQFESGQGITSKYVAKLISTYFDELITIDPHLHRWHYLSDIYSIPTTVLHAAEPIARWIHDNIKNPVLLGPDVESAQWVQAISQKTNVPFLVFNKIRKGDRLVATMIPHIDLYRESTPVLIDDIISTGMTMIESVHDLQALYMKPPICIGIHAVFAGNAYQDLLSAGVEKVVTCNTIQHVSNGIDISDSLVQLFQQ